MKLSQQRSDSSAEVLYLPAQEGLGQLAPSEARRLAKARMCRVLGATIFWALLALLVLTAIPYGTVEPWWEALFECGVFALAALWVCEGLLGNAWHVGGRSMIAPLLALIGFAFVQTLSLRAANVGASKVEGTAWWAISAAPYETRLVVLKWLSLVLTGALLMRYTSSRRRLQVLIYGIVGISVASAVFGLVRQAASGLAPSFLLSHLDPKSSYAQFVNRDHFAYLMEMAFGLLLGLMTGGGVSRDRLLLHSAAVVLLWTALVLSGSRGGIFGMCCQLMFVALFCRAVRFGRNAQAGPLGVSGRRWSRGRSVILRAVFAASLLAAIIVSVLWVGGDPLIRRLEATSSDFSESRDSNGSNSYNGGRHDAASRAEIWRATWRLIKDYPIAGVGFGGYWVAIPAYREASGEINPQQAHNDYLDLLAGGGIIGAAFGVWFVGAFVKSARRQLLRGADAFRRAACFGALAGIFGVAVHSIFDFGLHITINAAVFAALIVVATVDYSTEDAPEGKSLSRLTSGTFAIE